MLAEVATVLTVMKGLNDAISTLKETGAHASGLATVMSKYAKANESVQDVESKYVGKLSVQESMQIQVAKRQLNTFNQQLKDMMLMQGLASDYNEIMNRVEESRIAHEKEIARKKKLKKEREEFLKTFGVAFMWSCLGVCLMLAGIYFFS
jgi:uncharacterized membrane protein YjjP (DUF1212 family)